MTHTNLQPDTGTSSPQPFEQLVKYVRVRSKTGARFVEFDFAIGEPNLFVELIMPQGVFDDFCQKNHVVHMTAEQMLSVDDEMEKWRYGDETLMAANHRQDHAAQ
ncbi:MAG: phenol hydroxylase subunit [Motiliproteus sp.]